jgi:hypothetical protein
VSPSSPILLSSGPITRSGDTPASNCIARQTPRPLYSSAGPRPRVCSPRPRKRLRT